MSVRQVLIAESPFPADVSIPPWKHPGRWPAFWVQPHEGDSHWQQAYRLTFAVDHATTIRMHVTADERYWLFLDGQRIAMGSERGDRYNWYYETYDIDLAPGAHTFVALVWAIGEGAPFAQMTVDRGFFLCPQEAAWVEKLATGVAHWQVKVIHGFEKIEPIAAWGTGMKSGVRPRSDERGFERGLGENWLAVTKGPHGQSSSDGPEFGREHLLRPATLPAQFSAIWSKGRVRHCADAPAGPTSPHPILAADSDRSQVTHWQALIREDRALRVEPHSRKRILIDLEDYVCAYPELTTWGGAGATIRIHWQESLYEVFKQENKGNRDQIEGKYFTTTWSHVDGIGDAFYPNGDDRLFMTPLWWDCGRYVEVLVETAEAPLTIEHLRFRESRYPLKRTATFRSDDDRIANLMPLMDRVLQMCAHETYFDCPFYEQLMYIGDTRLETLATYVSTDDDRLPRKALRMFAASRQPSGVTQSRYPSRVRQTIPPFSLWFIGMVHDFALWRGDMAFVREMMPSVRSVLDWFTRYRRQDGLVSAPAGWNFIDWVRAWDAGVPPGGNDVCGILNIKLAWILRQAAELEEWVGEPEMASRWRIWSHRVTIALEKSFWSEDRGMFADDLAHRSFSEHAQCLALLGGWLDSDRSSRVAKGLMEAEDLHRTTIYFSYYLLETFGKLGRMDAFFKRMTLWFGLVDQGLKTIIEAPEPTRSDCHAWGAHPLVHLFTTVLGIRPTSPGFATYDITPHLGPLSVASGEMPTPRGPIKVSVHGAKVEVSGP